MATIYKKRAELVAENSQLKNSLLKIKADLELSEKINPCFEFIKSSINANTIILEKIKKPWR